MYESACILVVLKFLLWEHPICAILVTVSQGGGTRSESDGYVRPEMGGRKNDPYSDSKMIKKTPLL